VNRHRRLTVLVLVAGGALGGLVAMVATANAGPGCLSGPLLCGPSLAPFLGGVVLGAAVAGLLELVREVRSAPPRDRWIVEACCVAFGSGFVAALATLEVLLGVPLLALVCAGAVLASGLLLVGPDVVPALGLCLVAASGAWVVGQQEATALFLVPAALFWLAAGLIRIGSPSDASGAGGWVLRTPMLRPQVVSATAVKK
jgi:hypothetical protein